MMVAARMVKKLSASSAAISFEYHRVGWRNSARICMLWRPHQEPYPSLAHGNTMVRPHRLPAGPAGAPDARERAGRGFIQLSRAGTPLDRAGNRPFHCRTAAGEFRG